MALHPGLHQRDSAPPPLPRRPRERVAGGIFRAVTRVAGLRPEMLPEHLRRQARILGVTDAQLNRVLPKLRSLGAWPYAWEAEGDGRAAVGDWYGAFAAYYAGQRMLLAPSPLKYRLYDLATAAYAKVDQPTLEPLSVPNARGEHVAGYLQLPTNHRPGTPVPCVLMVPGVTGAKEEMHAYCMPLLRRGWAVARIDNPIYGNTEGILDELSVPNARVVFEHLARDPRIDASQIHFHGTSMGGNLAMRAAHGTTAASITVICPPYAPGRYFRELPTLNLTALQHMTRLPDIDALVDFASDNSLEPIASELTMPVRIFHGGRDRTVPVEEAHAMVRDLGGPTALTVYERDHHNCLEHADEIIALTLEFLDDPVGTCQRSRSVQFLDAAATLHVTDHDAVLATAGLEPSRRWARLPFLLPGVRPRAHRA